MAHFAKMENDTVTSVIVVSNEDCGGGNFPESEPIGQAFLTSLGLTGLWLQCSYHANFRGCWVSAGFTFDASLGEYGEFVPPYVEPVDEP
jgi:hypothetical protein